MFDGERGMGGGGCNGQALHGGPLNVHFTEGIWMLSYFDHILILIKSNSTYCHHVLPFSPA